MIGNFLGIQDLDYMDPPTSTLSSVRSWTTEFKPEAYGLPSGVAKYFGVTGIFFLNFFSPKTSNFQAFYFWQFLIALRPDELKR